LEKRKFLNIVDEFVDELNEMFEYYINIDMEERTLKSSESSNTIISHIEIIFERDKCLMHTYKYMQFYV
jgi:hypothetical protein